MKTINVNSILTIPIAQKQNDNHFKTKSVSGIIEGNRHHELYKFIATLRDKGTTSEQSLEIALAFNKAKCQPPLPNTEVEKSVKDVTLMQKENILSQQAIKS